MHKKLEHMKETLMCAIEMELCNLGDADYEELGAAIDMIKDLEEAIYYCTVTEAMNGSEKEIEFEMKKGDPHKQPQEGEYESRMYGGGYSMPYNEDQMMYARRRRADGTFYANGGQGGGSSYAQGGRGSSYAGGQGGGSSYAGGQGGNSSYAQGGNSSYAQGGGSSYMDGEFYADGEFSYGGAMFANGSSYGERDSREGRSYNSRRMYMEAKDMNKDKATQLRELEKYMQELSQDVVEMINDASMEEKQYLEKKIQALASKIGQMK